MQLFILFLVIVALWAFCKIMAAYCRACWRLGNKVGNAIVNASPEPTESAAATPSEAPASATST